MCEILNYFQYYSIVYCIVISVRIVWYIIKMFIDEDSVFGWIFFFWCYFDYDVGYIVIDVCKFIKEG